MNEIKPYELFKFDEDGVMWIKWLGKWYKQAEWRKKLKDGRI